MFGMWTVIVIAIGGIANHVLNPTTGKGMGYGFIAITFMAAFAFPIIGFGSVSAMLNPAAALSVVTAGLLGPGQFFTVVAGQMVGAILGAITVWIIYMPQLQKAGAKVFKFTDIKVCDLSQCSRWTGPMLTI
jgi:glycerol uptake facilitator protein